MPTPLPFASKKQLVYDDLLAGILEGRLAPGERLVIGQVAARMGVSHIPVREALQALAAEGFVESRPHAGATVTRLDPRLITEVFDLLEALEVLSGRRACERATGEDLTTLREHLSAMDRSIEDQEAWSRGNTGFHRLICRMGNCQLTETLFEQVTRHWNRVRTHFLSNVFLPHIPQAHAEHWRILAALERHDEEDCERLLRDHNRGARAAYEGLLAKSHTDG